MGKALCEAVATLEMRPSSAWPAANDCVGMGYAPPRESMWAAGSVDPMPQLSVGKRAAYGLGKGLAPQAPTRKLRPTVAPMAATAPAQWRAWGRSRLSATASAIVATGWAAAIGSDDSHRGAVHAQVVSDVGAGVEKTHGYQQRPSGRL